MTEMAAIDTVAIGRHVRILRNARNMNQDAFAALTGVSKSDVGRVEQGTFTPTLERLAVIAHALDTTIGRLIDGPVTPRMIDLSLLDDEHAAAIETIHRGLMAATASKVENDEILV